MTLVHNGEVLRGHVAWWRTNEQLFGVSVRGAFGELTAVASDLFEALADIRRRLETHGWGIAVQGARRDVYPSPQARKVVGAEQVWTVQPEGGVPRSVLIFDDAQPSDLATVDEQRAFWQAYVDRSPGRLRHLLGDHPTTVVMDGTPSPASVRWWLTTDFFAGVEVSGPFGREQAIEKDFLSALNAIRRRIEPAGWVIAVQGARRDVHPANRRTQGGCRKIWLIDHDPRDTVPTFDPVDPALAVTVDEQHDYWRTWAESSRRG